MDNIPQIGAAVEPRPLTSSSPADVFVYVDTAESGETNRNHVKRIDEIHPPAGATDCYSTWLRYPAQLVEWVKTHRNVAGNPTVSGYDGPGWADALYFDLDGYDAAGLDDVREDACRLLRFLDSLDVPLEAVGIWFSGSRGMHLRLPAALFGCVKPASDVNVCLRRFALRLAADAGATSIDPSLYDRMHLLRLPGTRHSATGLYKIPLSAAEVFALSADEIRALADEPRQLPTIEDAEWRLNSDLAALWTETDTQPGRRLSAAPRRSLRVWEPFTLPDRITTPGRNQTLSRYALHLRSAGAGMEEDEILARVLAAARDIAVPPITAQTDPAEYQKLVTMVSRTCAKYETGNGKAQPATLPAVYELSDLGNARRLVDAYGDQLRYCAGRWLVWTGTHWQPDETQQVQRCAQETARSIFSEAAAVDDLEQRKALGRWAVRSQSAERLAGAVRVASSQIEVIAQPADFDRDPWLLNCQNGTLDLRTGQLQSHAPSDLITRCVPVAYDASAQCPLWLKFLTRVLAGQDDLIAFVQRAIGYSLTGDTGEECLFLLYGTGRNGKTKFLEVVQALLGEYAQATPFDTLLHSESNSVRNDVARLAGARFVSASEANDGRRLDEALIKSITGGDKITARFLHREFFSFTPVLKLFVAANHRPNIHGGDEGIWSRIRMVPFTVTIPAAERDKSLLSKLTAELPGILAWAVRGCLAWQRSGLSEPAVVRDATAEYRGEMDILGPFLAAYCTFEPSAHTTTGDLWKSYRYWCAAEAHTPLSESAFGRRLGERPELARTKDRKGTRGWRGVGLNDDGRAAAVAVWGYSTTGRDGR